MSNATHTAELAPDRGICVSSFVSQLTTIGVLIMSKYTKNMRKLAERLVENEVRMVISDTMLSEEIRTEIFETGAEYMELWFVSSFIADRLKEQNETIVEWGWHNLWLRNGTGQALYMDCCWLDIAKQLEEA